MKKGKAIDMIRERPKSLSPVVYSSLYRVCDAFDVIEEDEAEQVALANELAGFFIRRSVERMKAQA